MDLLALFTFGDRKSNLVIFDWFIKPKPALFYAESLVMFLK